MWADVMAGKHDDLVAKSAAGMRLVRTPSELAAYHDRLEEPIAKPKSLDHLFEGKSIDSQDW
jgi:hypothetical protein